ncbi:hypothetical protein OIV83_003129 [Microbotryomycetes sp. JL201]|nr:hypothetical protein OIV83_003129 [Microbotryomycetes sp. JL201]
MASPTERGQAHAQTAAQPDSYGAGPSPLRVRLSTATAATAPVAAADLQRAGPSTTTVADAHAHENTSHHSRKRSRRPSSTSSSASSNQADQSRPSPIDLSADDGPSIVARYNQQGSELVLGEGGRRRIRIRPAINDVDVNLAEESPSPPDRQHRQGSSPLPDFSIPVNGRPRPLRPTAQFTSEPQQSLDKGKQRALSAPIDSTVTNANSNEGSVRPESLSSLQCPICFGSPTPLVLTSCGHAFCGPCLHAALVAGPPLTPPPPDRSARRGGRGIARRGRGRGAGGGPAAEAFLNRAGQRRNPRRNVNNNSNNNNNNNYGAHGPFEEGYQEDDVDGRIGARGFGLDDAEDWDNDAQDGPPTELDKHCPVCRAPLRGGWGRSLRGLYLRMAPKRAGPPTDDQVGDAPINPP